MPSASTATDSLLLVRPVHLAGPGDADLPYHLAAHHGWFRPYDASPRVVLVSDTDGLTLSHRAGPAPWSLAGPKLGSDWSIVFDDQVPAEIAQALLDDAATGVRRTPELFAGTGRLLGNDARTVLLAAGWSGHQRDGYELIAAPDRRAALAFPVQAPDSEVMLTGAAELGSWTVRFSPHSPERLLTSAASALLRPALRREAHLPFRHRHLLAVESLSAQSPSSARSGAARTRSTSALVFAPNRSPRPGADAWPPTSSPRAPQRRPV
ncbi:hypothetical protein ACIPLC_15700 [Kitasatospora sp. NPDC086801]|uniref:hypothetical protein n=1 Tax=unclassified Kitasatospora TaxID=2633591 RepID=UPI0038033B01